jgi:hypothetical protein
MMIKTGEGARGGVARKHDTSQRNTRSNTKQKTEREKLTFGNMRGTIQKDTVLHKKIGPITS